MIFIGNGSLLRNALKYSREKSHRIDYVLSGNDEMRGWCESHNIPIKIGNVNNEIETIKKYCSDNIVFSINNGRLIKEKLLNISGIKYYNIHNGVVPSYRGLPEICIIFAILNNESVYGVSLHEIDIGIDTGSCLDILKFSISEKDTFQDVMLKGIEKCNQIFYKNLDNILSNQIVPLKIENKSESNLYTYKNLDLLVQYRDNPNFKRATQLGVFRAYYKKLRSIINNLDSCV
jgi:methionyl-tRNA formyltransferase